MAGKQKRLLIVVAAVIFMMLLYPPVALQLVKARILERVTTGYLRMGLIRGS